MRWVCRAVVLLLPACFHPNYDRPTCGPGGACPSGLQCSAQGFCERPGSGAGSGDDAGIDAPGGGGGGDGGPIDTPPSGNGVCYGPSGWQVCLDAKASGQVQIPATLDTGTSTRCLSTLPSSWTASQPAACIVVGDTITVSSVSVTGNRPLVLVAETRITVTGLLDAASHHAGAVGAGAASSADCKPFNSSPGMGPPGGGGAGGGFMFPGGGGGAGNGAAPGTSVPGGQAASGQVGAPTRLHGGCAGQPGGGGNASDGGAGGGAVYLVSAGAILIPGKIDVSGAGGRGRDARIGGGGAGSGGMIVLFAPSISTMPSTLLIANGGGGGGGSSALDVSQATSKGDDGLEPVSPTAPASGGAGGQRDGFNGGDGGQGYPAASNTNPGLIGGTGDVGAGGGGGGGGGGYIRSNRALGAAAVSPAPDIKP